MSKAGKRLLGAAREMREIARGERKPAHIHVPPEIDVRAIRRGLDMTQDAFASEFGFSINQIRDWEQSRTRPVQSDRAYLICIQKDPVTVRRLLNEMRASEPEAAAAPEAAVDEGQMAMAI